MTATVLTIADAGSGDRRIETEGRPTLTVDRNSPGGPSGELTLDSAGYVQTGTLIANGSMVVGSESIDVIPYFTRRPVGTISIKPLANNIPFALPAKMT